MPQFSRNLVEVNPVFLMTVPSISGNFMKKITQGVMGKGKFVAGIFQRGLEAGIARNGDGFRKGGGWVRFKTWLPFTLANMLVFPKLRRIFGDRMQFCVGGGALLEANSIDFSPRFGVPIYQATADRAAPIISIQFPSRYKFGTSGMVARRWYARS
jgi:long-chain acyl-CoA synthetase